MLKKFLPALALAALTGLVVSALPDFSHARDGEHRKRMEEKVEMLWVWNSSSRS